MGCMWARSSLLQLILYYDADDETVDGKIHLDIVPNQGGYLEPGRWMFVWSTGHLS